MNSDRPDKENQIKDVEAKAGVRRRDVLLTGSSMAALSAAAAAGLASSAQAQPAAPTQEVLPRPEAPFGGQIGTT